MENFAENLNLGKQLPPCFSCDWFIDNYSDLLQFCFILFICLFST